MQLLITLFAVYVLHRLGKHFNAKKQRALSDEDSKVKDLLNSYQQTNVSLTRLSDEQRKMISVQEKIISNQQLQLNLQTPLSDELNALLLEDAMKREVRAKELLQQSLSKQNHPQEVIDKIMAYVDGDTEESPDEML